jgi:two-component system, cell cycle sensor histidine kinase and response regulator CckA
MKKGGILTFKTNIEVIDANFSEERNFEITSGKYLKTSVSDTGAGMSKEILKHIFEPFFTTKNKSEGTGMGLAAVYGTVKNHKGFVDVDSIVDQGTTINIYLPLNTD